VSQRYPSSGQGQSDLSRDSQGQHGQGRATHDVKPGSLTRQEAPTKHRIGNGDHSQQESARRVEGNSESSRPSNGGDENGLDSRTSGSSSEPLLREAAARIKQSISTIHCTSLTIRHRQPTATDPTVAIPSGDRRSSAYHHQSLLGSPGTISDALATTAATSASTRES
jgi:hypothetical protein